MLLLETYATHDIWYIFSFIVFLLCAYKVSFQGPIAAQLCRVDTFDSHFDHGWKHLSASCSGSSQHINTLLVCHCSMTLSRRKISLNSHTWNSTLQQRGKMTLWEIWQTPKWKPCCDQVHSLVSIFFSLSPPPHKYEDFHHCTHVRVTLHKRFQMFGDGSIFKYYFANQILPPKDQHLHWCALIYGNGRGCWRVVVKQQTQFTQSTQQQSRQIYFSCNVNKLQHKQNAHVDACVCKHTYANEEWYLGVGKVGNKYRIVNILLFQNIKKWLWCCNIKEIIGYKVWHECFI